MALFSKKSGTRLNQTIIRTSDCIYRGESFPKRGERILAGAVEYELALDPTEVPETWTDVSEFIRLHTSEPRERRVLTNILGTMLGMVELELDTIGLVLGVSEVVPYVRGYLRQGGNSVNETKAPFVDKPGGSLIWDFEIIKIISLLISPRPRQSRESNGWPYPEVWGGNSDAFPYPY